MAQTISRVADFLAVLARSKLMPADTVSIIGKAWKGDADDVEGMRKLLVSGKHLTEYQAAMLARGHADGFQVGGYTIQGRIGKGQSAGVYLGKHPSGQIVAIKVLPGSKAKNPNVLGRFQREGRLLTQLDHANIVRAFQIGTAKDAHFIAMEHLDGETLDDVLTRRKRLPIAEACRLVAQILDGLQHLADNRMIHRDVKPANIMLTPITRESTLTATVKLVDIGLGRELFDEGGETTHDLSLTREGAILGTPDYLAPEQARDARTADIRSDIYSAGCVLYHLITGRTPFGGTNIMAQMVMHATEHAPRLATYLPDAPPSLQIVIDRLLAKDPADRFQTPAEAAETLKAFLPAQNQKAEGTQVLPAYREWLAIESNRELPVIATPAPVGTPAPAGTTKRSTKTVPQEVVEPIAKNEFNVELVVFPPTASTPSLELPPRGWFDLDRRDWVMLAAGFFLSCIAIGTGYGLAQWLGKK